MLPITAVEGRVVGDVKFKHTENGTAMTQFRLKAADRVKGDDGKWADREVLWVTVRAFGPLAEIVAESLRDGDQAVVIGKWSTAEWTDETGAQRSAPKFVATAVGAGLQFSPRRHHDATGREVTSPAVSVSTPTGTAPTGYNEHDPWA
jgi:single-strand DNA-binding protein